jgi:hypothetical protein
LKTSMATPRLLLEVLICELCPQQSGLAGLAGLAERAERAERRFGR